MSRIDAIGRNGNDGRHYLVEKVARKLAGKFADMPLGGKSNGKSRWELHIDQAIEVIDEVEKHYNV